MAALWLLSILYTFSASAEEACPRYRLDQTPSLSAIPRWDQEDSFLCYAFSAAILIDARKTSSFTSPLGLAADTVQFSFSRSQRSGFWGGQLQQSIEVARREGACRSAWLSDGLGKRKLKELLPALRAFHMEAKKGGLAVASGKLKAFLEEGGGAPSAEFLVEILAKPQSEFLSALIGSYCEERMPVELPALHSEDRSFRPNKISFAERVNDVLGSGSPLAAEFCAEVVTDPRFSPGYSSVCNRHYVVVVGQQSENGRCELLIRDSQCSQYKKRAGNSGCEDSHYWIDRGAFLSNTQSMHWLR